MLFPVLCQLFVALAYAAVKIDDAKLAKCVLPEGGLEQWEYVLPKPWWEDFLHPSTVLTGDTPLTTLHSEGPYRCSKEHDDIAPWAMLNAYQSGGKEYAHWIYTDSRTNPYCLRDWTYYDRDGVTVIAKINGTVTKLRDKDDKWWCPIARYRRGGKEGKQWAHCKC